MINRTKIFTIALTGALAAVALTGCGGSASSSAAPSSVSTAAAESPASSAAASAVVDNAAENGSDALDGVFNALLEADPISNQFEIAAMNIEYDFGLKAEDVVSYKGVKSIRWPSTATTPSLLRRRITWRTLSSPSRATPLSW